ncbi:hypothetical protein T265_14966, partial [Opisthorchis viverrini]
MLSGGNKRAEVLPSCLSLDRVGREADVGFEPRTLQSCAVTILYIAIGDIGWLILYLGFVEWLVIGTSVLTVIIFRFTRPTVKHEPSCAVTILYIAIGDIGWLILYLGFVEWLVIGTSVLTVIIFRFTRPTVKRPVKPSRLPLARQLACKSLVPSQEDVISSQLSGLPYANRKLNTFIGLHPP